MIFLRMLYLLTLLLLYSNEVHHVEAQSGGVGQVFIGTGPTDITTSYTFSSNYNPTAWSIPVYVTVINSDTGVEIPFDNATVSVTCQLQPNLVGYTNVTFIESDVTITNETGYNTGKVNFGDPVTMGKMTDVQCWSNTSPQFNQANSISPAKKFTYTMPPKVNPYYTLFSIGQPVWITLSEIALTDVQVTCVGVNVTFNPSPVTISSGNNIAQAPYVVSTGSTSATFSCTAQSTSGYQFLTASSRGATAQLLTNPAVAFLYPSLAMLDTTAMTELLVLNQMPSQSVIFYCALTEVSTKSEADNIMQSTVCPPTRASSTQLWRLAQSSENLTFTQSTSFGLIYVSRSEDVTQYTEEMFVVKCCVPPSAAGEFSSATAASLTYAYLYPPRPFNYTSGTDQANLTVPSGISNPAYAKLGGCYCDLTENVCDQNCCCDQVCTDEDYLTFNCQTRMDNRDLITSELKSQMYCNSTYGYTRRNWLPIMCIMKENGGFIGFVNYPGSLIVNSTYYTTVYNTYSTGYSYRSSQPLAPSGPAGINYTQGSTVRTGIQRLSTQLQLNKGSNYYLSLPQTLLTGSCSPASPVGYLIDSSSTCVQSITQNNCETEASINALLYAQGTGISSTAPYILSAQDGTEVTEVIVNYYCDPDGSKYTRSTQTYDNLVPSDQTKYFGSQSPSSLTDCQFNPTTGAYQCVDNSVNEVTASLPPRCSYDDGYTPPPSPNLITSSECNDVVVRVLYNFTWSGQTLTLLNATVILTNIILSDVVDVSVPLVQQFDTTFVSTQSSSSSGSTAESANDTTVYPLSGNPGYRKLSPVISGILDNVTTSGTESEQVNTARQNRLRLWSPDSSGLCNQSNTGDILFGTNAVSGCILRLNLNDFSNCTNLRKLVLSGQDSIMPSGLISILGNTSYTNFSNWAPVLRQNMVYILENATSNLTDNSTDFSYLSEVQGTCGNIPSGIHATILYTQAGLSNYHPIYTIVGAMVNYTLATWNWNCGGMNAASCAPGSTNVQSFTVTSSVNFYLVPPVGTAPPSRWEQTKGTPPYLCKGNACWWQTFYPFMKINPGASQSGTLALGLLFIIFGIFLVRITGPITEWG